MLLRPLALICAFFCAAQPAAARDLPTGEFLLTGPVLPGIQEGNIVPVFVHLTTRPGHLEWRFVTYFAGDALNCEEFGKCQAVVQPLSHDVEWQDDGRFEITKVMLPDSLGLTIDRPVEDVEFIYPDILSMVESGILSLTEQGGTWLAKSEQSSVIRQVFLTPFSLEETQGAIAYIGIFELSFARLNQCGISQLAKIINSEPQDDIGLDVLETMRFAQHLKQLNDAEGYYNLGDDGRPDPEKHEKIKAERDALQLGIQSGMRLVQDTIDQEKSPSGLNIWAEVTQSAKDNSARFDPLLGRPMAELLNEWRPGIIATVKLMSRFSIATSKGLDPYQAVCSDVTMRAFTKD